MPKLVTAGVVTLVLAGLACSQRVETEEEYARRGRDRPLLPSSAAPPMLLGSGDRPVDPPGAASAAERGAPGVSGTVTAAGLEVPPPGAVLFLIVRPADRAEGPPLAVRRLTPSRFPVVFEIGPRDAMLSEGAFPERVTVEARLDSDGDPLTRSPADRSAGSGPIRPGTTNLTLGLDGD